jgi:hypothetical protein
VVSSDDPKKTKITAFAKTPKQCHPALPAQVTYDFKRAGEDKPGVAKPNEPLRFPQTLVTTSLTHPRRGDPLRGYVPTEPRAVSPRTNKVTRRRGPNQSQPIEHPRHSSKSPTSENSKKGISIF